MFFEVVSGKKKSEREKSGSLREKGEKTFSR